MICSLWYSVHFFFCFYICSWLAWTPLVGQVNRTILKISILHYIGRFFLLYQVSASTFSSIRYLSDSHYPGMPPIMCKAKWVGQNIGHHVLNKKKIFYISIVNNKITIFYLFHVKMFLFAKKRRRIHMLKSSLSVTLYTILGCLDFKLTLDFQTEIKDISLRLVEK